MGRKPTIKQTLFLEYVKKFPNTTKMGLAKIMYKENPSVFKDVESARDTVRAYTEKPHMKKHGFKGALQNYKDILKAIPLTDMVVHERYELKGKRKILVIGDLHIPYHDPVAIAKALTFDQSYDTILINGDLFDFHQISRHEKDPRKKNVAEELRIGKEFFKMLREKFPSKEIIWYFGNHDHRYRKYIWQFAPQLMGVPELELTYFLGLNELNIKVVDNNRGIVCGKLDIMHGHEYLGSGGVNPSRAYYLKAKNNVLVNHVHRSTSFTAKTSRNKIEGGFSVGCLCELSPDYFPFNDHVHGFALITLNEDGSFRVDNKMIINGEVI